MSRPFHLSVKGVLLPAIVLLYALLWGSIGARAQAVTDDFETDAIELGEVTVTAPMNDIELVGDTTVIRVGAFKTSRGARLEELVAKIPGMRYDRRTGTLYYNGERLNEVNINGRKLDLGDIATVLETIPVEILSKLKVYDKLSEMELWRGIPDPGRNKNMVLDLTTDDRFSSMYMSELKAAQGTEHKRLYSADIKRFDRNGNHAMAVANTGNLRAQSVYPDNRTDDLRASLQTTLGKHWNLGGSATYTHDINGSQSSSGNEEFLLTGSRMSYATGENLRKTRAKGIHVNTSYKPNNSIYTSFAAGYFSNGGSTAADSRQASLNGNPGLDFRNPFGEDGYDHVDPSMRINDMTRRSTSCSKNRNTFVSTDFSKKFRGKAMSDITLRFNYNHTENEGDNFSLSRTTYYELRNVMGNDSVLLRNQLRRTPTRYNSLMANLSYSHFSFKAGFLTANYSIRSQRSRSVTSTYDLSPFSPADGDTFAPSTWLPDGFETAFVDSLSNHTLSNTLSHSFNIQSGFDNGKVSVRGDMSVMPTRQTLDQKTGRVTADTVRHSVDFAGGLSLSYHQRKYRTNLNYRVRTEQPQLSDLLTLTDNSDPLYITRGNPGLKTSLVQDIDASFDHETIGLHLDSRWNSTARAVTRATTYNLTTGGIETRPVNVNGNWRWDNSARYIKRLRRRYMLSTEWGCNLSRAVSLMNESGRDPEPSRSITRSRTVTGEVRADYSPEWGSMNLSGRWSHDYSRNQLRDQRNYVRSYSINYDVFVDLPANIQLKTDISYSWRNGSYITPGEDDQLLWNLEASWRFLRHRQASLSVQWRDILSRSKDFSRVVTASHISERYSRVIGSYFLATFSYQFQLK